MNAITVQLKDDGIKKRFEEVLGQKAAAFMSSIISATHSGALASAEPMSVISAGMVAATLDLPINPSLGFAHLVPYSGKAQFQMGWRGYVQLAQRTGLYQTMNVAEVHEGDVVSHNHITGEIVFSSESHKKNPVIGYVGYFKLISGFEKYLYMSNDEVKEHGRKYSRAFDKKEGRWQQDFGSMAKKTVLKMLLSKWAPLSTDMQMQKAIESDQAVVGIDGTYQYPDNPNSTQTQPPPIDKKQTPKQEYATLTLQVEQKCGAETLNKILKQAMEVNGKLSIWRDTEYMNANAELKKALA